MSKLSLAQTALLETLMVCHSVRCELGSGPLSVLGRFFTVRHCRVGGTSSYYRSSRGGRDGQHSQHVKTNLGNALVCRRQFRVDLAEYLADALAHRRQNEHGSSANQNQQQ